uniref:uncharacterized protein n=1 Tax=Myxine glutinosa TaxID=7769 RepID=UPI00358E46A4
MEALPPDKRPKSVDFKLCFICQTGVRQADYKSYVAKPALDSIQNIIDSAQLRYGYGDTDYAELNARVQDFSAEQLINEGVSYHKRCYANVTHKGNIDKAKTRFKKAALVGDVAVIRQKKIGRPSCSAADSPSTSVRGRREKYTDNIKCVLCAEDTRVKLHDVATKNMGSQFMEIGRNTNDVNLKARLSNVIAATDPLAAVAYDIRYHLPCFVKAKRDIARAKEPRSAKTFGQAISDLEILEVIANELKTRETALNMNDIQTTYINILEGNGVPLTSKQMYKPFLKQLILDNIPDVHFNRPPDKTKPEQVLPTKVKEAALSTALETEDLTGELKILLKAATIVRRDIANSPNWKFRGTFQDYEPPPLLYTFCKHAIQGSRPIQTERRRTSVDQSASVLAQHFVQAYKSDRQVSFTPKYLGSDFRNLCETPLSVGLALDVHKNTRSKTLVSKLEQLDIGISYSKVMEIETGIANTVRKQMDSVGGLCLPPWLVKDTFVWYALDNIDFLEATPCGMNTLHGTAIAVYQSTDHNKPAMLPKVEIDRTSSSQTLVDAVECEYHTCKKPEIIKKKFPCKLSSSHPITDMSKKTDMAWIIGCLDLEEHSDETQSQTTSSETQLRERDDEPQAQNETPETHLDTVEDQTQATQEFDCHIEINCF